MAPPKVKKKDMASRSKSTGRAKSKSKHRANLSDESEDESSLKKKSKKEQSTGFFGGIFGIFGSKPKHEASSRNHSIESKTKHRGRSNSSQRSEFKSGQMLEKKRKNK